VFVLVGNSDMADMTAMGGKIKITAMAWWNRFSWKIALG
jgi:hypothetical protein